MLLDTGSRNQVASLWSPSTPSNSTEVWVFPWQHALWWDSHVICRRDALVPIPWIREQRFTREKVHPTCWLHGLVPRNTSSEPRCYKGYKRTGTSSPVLFGFLRTCSRVSKHGPKKVFTAISKSLRLGCICCRSPSKLPQPILQYSSLNFTS